MTVLVGWCAEADLDLPHPRLVGQTSRWEVFVLVNTDGLVLFGPGSEWFWSWIASARRNVRIAEELRAVVVRPPTGEAPTKT